MLQVPPKQLEAAHIPQTLTFELVQAREAESCCTTGSSKLQKVKAASATLKCTPQTGVVVKLRKTHKHGTCCSTSQHRPAAGTAPAPLSTTTAEGVRPPIC